ncbi:MAG: S9 family peptidase [Gammaproteobacteria bacterium]|nr:S9 family peptidase [Gammaproteobacteria bacterium]
MRKILLVLLFVFISPNWVTAAPTADAFGTLPNAYDAAISPDGKQVAIIVNNNGKYGVRIVTLGKKNEKLRAILLGKGVKPQWIKWANNEQVLIAFWQSKKYRAIPYTMSFIYTLNATSMKGKILIESKEVFRQDNSSVIDFLEDDPDHILMEFSDTNQNHVDIKRVNVKSGLYITIKRTKQGVQKWFTDARGEPRVGQGLVDRTGAVEEQWSLTIRDADEDQWRRAENFAGLEADVTIFGFTDDPNELVIGDHAGQDTLGLYVYDLIKKEVTRKLFHHDTYDAGGLVVSGNGAIIGASFVADSNEIELFDEYDTVLSRMRNKFSDHTVDYVDQSGDGRLYLFRISNAYDPGALAIVDASTNNVTVLAYIHKELPTAEMGSVTKVTYPARDDFEIPAYLTLPPTITSAEDLVNLPVVILPHGGPYARQAKRFDYFAQYFATRGFAVLQMNFRGSAGYGKGFEDEGRENWVKMQEDVEDGAKWILEQGIADPDRICIAGWSYGGYAALMGAIKSPELYACAISMAGVTDLKDMINDIKQYRFGSIAAQNFVLRGFDSKQEIAENSPVFRAAEIKVPLFLAHGESDQRVHFDQFRRMKSALRKSSAPVTYMSFENEDHFLSNQKNRQAFFRGLDKFLSKVINKK